MNSSADANLQRFLQWGAANGVYISENVEFKYDRQKGISCVYKGITPNSEPIDVYVPHTTIVNGHHAQDVLEKALGKSLPYSKASVLLIWFLCYARYGSEQTKRHFQKHREYVDLLPVAVDTPLLWTNEAELDALKNTNIFASRNQKIDELTRNWKAEKAIFGSAETENVSTNTGGRIKPTDFATYIWAYTIVTSRSFPEYVVNPDVTDKSRCVLVPFVDLLNHNPSARVEWSNTQTRANHVNGFNVKCESTFSRGDEIFNNYGIKSNEELLFGYGFVIENNTADYFSLKLRLDEETCRALIRRGVQLNPASDYSTNAFELSENNLPFNSNSEEKIGKLVSEGAFFLLRKGDPHKVIKNLVTLFAYIEHDTVDPTALRAQLQGIRVLYENLQNKLNLLPTEEKFDDLSEEAENPYHIECARTYVGSARRILSYSMKYLEVLEQKKVQKHHVQCLTPKHLSMHPEVSNFILTNPHGASALEYDTELLFVIYTLVLDTDCLDQDISGVNKERIDEIWEMLDSVKIAIDKKKLAQILSFYDERAQETLSGEVLIF
ncbi:hypothetical protein ACO0QE_003570 [Hanseniaspora vineae]